MKKRANDMAEQPMKVLVVSDVHGRVTPLRWLLKNETADALFFLGDGLYDLDQAIAANGAAPDYPIYRVRGNCDIGFDDPAEGLAPFGGVLFFYTHGHLFGVKSGYERIAEYAADHSYWVNTSENSILRNALEVQGRSFEKEYETLVTEGEVEVTVDFSMTYYEKMDEANLWGLLVNAGIVTITKEIEEDYYRLRVPNLEVWKVFKELTACHLKIDERHMEKMLNALKRKDMERFAEEYQGVLLELPSYHDLKDENSYHMMTLGMCAFLRKDYDIKSNRETGEGRSDICLYAKHDRYPNLILEFKYTKDEKDDLEKLAEKALEQIKEKQYPQSLLQYTGQIILIGINYDKKTKEHSCKIERFERVLQ